MANDCWGGILASKLGLQMKSPLCNCYIGKEDYYQLLCNMKKYLQNGLYLYREGDIKNCKFPIGVLTDGKQEVLVNFNHHCTFDEAKTDWYRRLERMDYNNVFVKVEVTENDRDYIQKFSRLQYKKVIFAPTDYGDKTCVSIPHYLWRCYNCTASGTTTFSAFLHRMNYFLAAVVVLEMLVGEDTFIREV